jgi:5-formyltetrahydrofolate cyclo-ligase
LKQKVDADISDNILTNWSLNFVDPPFYSDMASSNLKAAKKMLRNTMRLKLLSLSPEEISRQCDSNYFDQALLFKLSCTADSLARHLFSSEIFKKSRAVACYLSLPEGEINTWPIALEILRNGRTTRHP